MRDYPPGSPERATLKARLDEMAGRQDRDPAGDRRPRGADGAHGAQSCRTPTTTCWPSSTGAATPRCHRRSTPRPRRGGVGGHAVEARAAVFLRAAELLAGPWRDTLNAATMLGQSKTVYQAEIDAACELIDFWRFNVAYLHRLIREQPVSSPGVWNRIDYRPLEGFVFAVSPFNFTAIAGNLPTAPAMMGNTVVFKPASTVVYSAHFLMKLSRRRLAARRDQYGARLGADVGDPVLAHPDLAGIHFTGSTPVFQGMWQTIGENIDRYRSTRAGRRDRRQGLHLRAPLCRPGGVATAIVRGRSSTRARSARRRRASTRPRTCGRIRVRRWAEVARSRWATCATSGTSWARSSTPARSHPEGGAGAGGGGRDARCWSAARPTTAAATSSRRP